MGTKRQKFLFIAAFFVISSLVYLNERVTRSTADEIIALAKAGKYIDALHAQGSSSNRYVSTDANEAIKVGALLKPYKNRESTKLVAPTDSVNICSLTESIFYNYSKTRPVTNEEHFERENKKSLGDEIYTSKDIRSFRTSHLTNLFSKKNMPDISKLPLVVSINNSLDNASNDKIFSYQIDSSSWNINLVSFSKWTNRHNIFNECVQTHITNSRFTTKYFVLDTGVDLFTYLHDVRLPMDATEARNCTLILNATYRLIDGEAYFETIDDLTSTIFQSTYTTAVPAVLDEISIGCKENLNPIKRIAIGEH